MAPCLCFPYSPCFRLGVKLAERMEGGASDLRAGSISPEERLARLYETGWLGRLEYAEEKRRLAQAKARKAHAKTAGRNAAGSERTVRVRVQGGA